MSLVYKEKSYFLQLLEEVLENCHLDAWKPTRTAVRFSSFRTKR